MCHEVGFMCFCLSVMRRAPDERSCKPSTFWKPSPSLEDHNPLDKPSPGSSLCNSHQCQTPCLLSTNSLSRTSYARQPARSPTLPTDLPTWTPGVNLPGINPRIDDRSSQASSLTSTSSRFQPQPVSVSDPPQCIK
ncbi:hypothetical protein CHARACLAT_016387 [Characodon lateralis]|uniref:Uncharacterized protein n=1 Tax=Characodon lateralis TaxID=208331 RepID=A0ABU7DHD4_9TELE|nr:hypothetical protein [Characodon lateralis]